MAGKLVEIDLEEMLRVDTDAIVNQLSAEIAQLRVRNMVLEQIAKRAVDLVQGSDADEGKPQRAKKAAAQKQDLDSDSEF